MAKNDVTAVFSQPPYNGEYAFKRTAQGYNLEIRMSLPGRDDESPQRGRASHRV